MKECLIPNEILDNTPSTVRNGLRASTPEKQEEFVEEYRRKCKNPVTGFILALIGFHYLYFGKIGLQILFWITWGGFGCWWFIDLFRVSSIAKNLNKDVSIDVYRNIKIVS